MSTQTTGNYPNLTAKFGTVTFVDPMDAGQKAYYAACRSGNTPIKPSEAEEIAANDPDSLETYHVFQNEFMILKKAPALTK